MILAKSDIGLFVCDEEGCAGGVGIAKAGDYAADEFFEAGVGGSEIGFCLTDRLFPCWGESGGLFTHQADGGFIELQLAEFRLPRLLLKGGKIDAQRLILALEIFQFTLQDLIPARVDFELGIEMAGEVSELVADPLVLAGQVALCGERGLPNKTCHEEPEQQTPGEVIGEDGFKRFHIQWDGVTGVMGVGG